MIEIIGWIGSLLFAVCCIPQVIKVYRTHRTNDLSWMFLFLWFFGEVLSALYLILSGKIILPILFNYVLNFLQLCYILFAKFKYDYKFKKNNKIVQTEYLVRYYRELYKQGY
jgi:uncharacterized protein with PQ loop repeat